MMVGASCLDIRLTDRMHVQGTTETYPYYTNRMPSYYSGLVRQVADGEFRELLGYPIPSDLPDVLCEKSDREICL